MARFRKFSSFTWLLLAIIALQFAGLLGLLLAEDRQPSSDGSAEVSGDTSAGAEDTDIPDWLRPADPEPVREKEPPEGALSAEDILSGAQVIAHGMGAVEGVATLNCLEGFQQQ